MRMLVLGSLSFGVVVGWVRAGYGLPVRPAASLTLMVLAGLTLAVGYLVGGEAAAGPVGGGLILGWFGHLMFRALVTHRARAARSGQRA